jgi:hypothetical protein
MQKDEQMKQAPPAPSLERIGTTVVASDRRKALRHALRAGVIFSWEGIEGKRYEGRGHTRDLGQRGAFIVAPVCPPSGARVSLSITFPGGVVEGRTFRMEAQGRVLRARRASEAASDQGFAVTHHCVNLFSN